MNREAVHRYIDDHLEEHVAHIQRWVRQQSVSWDKLGVEECAGLVAQSYRDLGCKEVEVIEGRYHPGVWAHYDAGAPVTVHSYCMFDTRPVRPEGWEHDPWGAELVPMGPHPRALVGRGAMGAKGPYVAFLNALSAIIAVEGALPVNIMFLAEGEELMGSPSYRDFVERYRHRLQEVSASYCLLSSQGADGAVTVGLGLKGMVVMELTASGASWGRGPATTIHSSGASLVESPALRLAQALATMVDEGGQCRVKGLAELWPYRKPLTAEERGLLERLAAHFRGKDWRDVLPLGGSRNVPQVVGGLDGTDPLINFLYGPTFNLAGLRGGFLGPETHTIPMTTPHQATATLDMRMVVDLPPEEVIGCLRRHLDEHGFPDIQFHVYSAYSHSQTPASHPAVQSVLKTLKEWGVEAVVWPIQAVGGPWTAVPNAFGVPCIRGGAIGGGAGAGGAANEYIVIEGDGKIAGLAEVEKYHVDLLYNYARSAEGRA